MTDSGTTGSSPERVDVRLLGGFGVEVDGRPVPDDAWPQRRAADLVKLLALAPRHRLARDRIVETLWPQLGATAGGANLHKAASNARRALGSREAIVLSGGQVELAPGAAVTTDVGRLEDDVMPPDGELLPDDRYEAWTIEAREHLRAVRLERLRDVERWHDVLAEEPADEAAHRALMRSFADAGDRAAALRQFDAAEHALLAIGLQPTAETLALRNELTRGPAVTVGAAARDLSGRESDRGELDGLVERAADGQGGVAWLTGDAGIGKTALAETVLAAAEELDFHTLRGEAHDGDTLAAPAWEALEPLIDRRPELFADLPRAARAAIERLGPFADRSGAAASAAADPTASEPGAGHVAHAAIGRLFESAAAERGVALLLENLHNADADTLRLAAHLARLAPRRRMLLVLTTRPSSRQELERLAAAIVDGGAATVIEVGPVDLLATAAICERAVGRRLGDEVVRSVDAAAAGNPFLVEQLAIGAGVDGTVTVPGRVQQALDARLTQLWPRADDDALAAALAVSDDGFSTAELASLIQRDEQTVSARLERAAREGLLSAGRRGWRFRQPLLRDALCRRIPADDLRALHASAAAQLEADGAPAERIAHHLLHAGHSEEAVPRLLEAASWALDVGAFADAQRWLEDAVVHARGPEHAAALDLLAAARAATGDARAVATCEQALAVAPPERRVGLQTRRAKTLLVSGRLAEAAEAVAAIKADTALEAARVDTIRGLMAWFAGELGVARELADSAAVAVEADGTPADRAGLSDLRGLIAHAAAAPLESAPRAVGDDGAAVAGQVFDGHLCVSEYGLRAGQALAPTAALARTLQAESRRAGAGRGEAFAATVLGETELLAGNLERARVELAHAARLSRALGAVNGESLARARLGEALLHAGDADAAAGELEEALALATAAPLARHLLFIVNEVLVELPRDPEATLAAVARANELLADRGRCALCPPAYLFAAARACARAGRPALGRELLAVGEQALGPAPPPVRLAAAAEAQGALLAAEERAGDARPLLRRAAAGYAAAGQRLYEQRASRALAALPR